MWRDCHRDIYLVNSKYDVYFVSWNGEQYDPHCSMNFKLNSYGLTSFEVCAKISVLSLNCNGPEVIFAKIFGHDTKVSKADILKNLRPFILSVYLYGHGSILSVIDRPRTKIISLP